MPLRIALFFFTLLHATKHSKKKALNGLAVSLIEYHPHKKQRTELGSRHFDNTPLNMAKASLFLHSLSLRKDDIMVNTRPTKFLKSHSDGVPLLG